MEISEIKHYVRSYKVRRMEAQQHPDYSPEGRKKLVAKLDQERQQLRAEFYDELARRWKEARLKHERLDSKRRELEAKAAGEWDYSRLAYMKTVIAEQVRQAGSLDEVRRLYNRAQQSGDRHEARAWSELLPGILENRFAGDSDRGGLMKQAKNDLEAHLVPEALAKVRQEQADHLREISELLEVTDEAHRFYSNVSDNDVFGLMLARSEFSELTNGVEVERVPNSPFIRGVSFGEPKDERYSVFIDPPDAPAVGG